MKTAMSIILGLLLFGCTLLPKSPESQIQQGAIAHKGASVSATNLLKRGRMSVDTAKGYSTVLHTTRDALNGTNAELLKCRKDTGSTAATTPDPCKGNIAVDINLFTSILLEVESTLKAKEK